jgi:hypothetical protein
MLELVVLVVSRRLLIVFFLLVGVVVLLVGASGAGASTRAQSRTRRSSTSGSAASRWPVPLHRPYSRQQAAPTSSPMLIPATPNYRIGSVGGRPEDVASGPRLA